MSSPIKQRITPSLMFTGKHAGKAEEAITEASIRELLAKLDTIPPVTMVEVAPVDLASFDQLCLEMGVRQ